MKVLFIDNYPAPYRAEQYNLIAEKVDLTVVYGVDNDKTRNANYKFDDKKYKTIFLYGLRIGPTANLTFKIKKVIKEGNYDVVLVGGYDSPMAMIAMRYMKRHKIPFILNADGGFIKEDEPKWKKKLKTYFISMPTAWITSGDFTIKYLEYYGAKRENVYIYPFAFNYKNERCLPSSEQRQALKKKLGINGNNNILFVGRMMDFKNFDLTLKAFEGLKTAARMYVAGVEELPDKYKGIVSDDTMKKVTFIGFKSKDELREWYQASDMFVLASKWEVWGLVVNEALTNSCPTIVSDMVISGMTLIKDGYNGLVVPADNKEALTDAFERLLNDAELRKTLSENAYKSMENFNIETSAQRYVEIINDFHKKYVCK